MHIALSDRTVARHADAVLIAQRIAVDRIRFAVGTALLVLLAATAFAPLAVRNAGAAAARLVAARLRHIGAVDVVLHLATVAVRLQDAAQRMGGARLLTVGRTVDGAPAARAVIISLQR